MSWTPQRMWGEENLPLAFDFWISCFPHVCLALPEVSLEVHILYFANASRVYFAPEKDT